MDVSNHAKGIAARSPADSAIDHLRSVLERRLEDHPGRILLLTHHTPDPDALGALHGLSTLLTVGMGLDVVIATMGRIHRAENLAMVAELKLDFENLESLNMEGISAALLVDSQPTFGHTPLPEGVPLIAVFDHHEPPKNGQVVTTEHDDIRLGVGSTSSIVYEYLRDAKVPLDEMTATALCCGIRFDTQDLSYNTTDLDEEAYFETLRRADRRMLARIQRPPLPASYYKELHRSLSRGRKHGPLVFGLLGRVLNPESVAEVADFFLRMEGARWSFVGGEYQGVYHLSIRTKLSYGRAYPLMSSILQNEGSFGGRGTVAGGQVQLGDGGDQVLRTLERRLRSRALKLVPASELKGSDPRFGTRLLRIP